MKINSSGDKHSMLGGGWEIVGHGLTLFVGNLPGRLRPCLYVRDTNNKSVIYPLAYFIDGEKAKEAMALIDTIARASSEDSTDA